MECGTVIINKIISENTKINSGIGKLEVNLQGKAEDYEITVSTGIGSVYLNGEKCLDDKKYGEGQMKMQIDGGIGSTNITIK